MNVERNWNVPDSQISIDGDPHEGVNGYRPESNFQIANETTHDVPVDPSSYQRRIHRKRNHQQTTKKVRRRERQQVVVYHLGGTCAVWCSFVFTSSVNHISPNVTVFVAFSLLCGDRVRKLKKKKKNPQEWRKKKKLWHEVIELYLKIMNSNFANEYLSIL